MKTGINLDDTQVNHWLRRLTSVARNPRPALVAIGRYGKTSTQLRFRTQLDPQGRPWLRSKRAKEQSGQTLRDSNRLFRSITWSAGSDYAEWGTNVVYAPAHNFGVRKMISIPAHRRHMSGTSKSGRAWAKAVPVKAHRRMMFLPQRQFIGFSAADRAEILDILREHAERAAETGGA
jgi:phage virion morphogenesis protein